MTSPPAPMTLLPAMKALVVLVCVVEASALPTPTKPPAELLTVARALVVESASTDTWPCAALGLASGVVASEADAM